jgi:hypothetical protein
VSNSFLLVSESAFDVLISRRETRLLQTRDNSVRGVYCKGFSNGVVAFGTGHEQESEFCALIDEPLLQRLSGNADAMYTRIARVLKSARNPPVHLPRSWAEYHFKNRLTFFVGNDDDGAGHRWLAEIDGTARVVRFLGLSHPSAKINLAEWTPPAVMDPMPEFRRWVSDLASQGAEAPVDPSFSEQVDLKAIGSDAVVQGYSYDTWLQKLKDEQLRIVNSDLSSSIRVIGPAGSGKTLTLCMRAVRIARDPDVVATRKKILIVTHSWAMTERIDGILHSLGDGHVSESISVMPLLYILQSHAGAVGQVANSVLGEDSAEGQRIVLDILNQILEDQAIKPSTALKAGMSPYLSMALESQHDHIRTDLLIDLYEEIIGVLSPQGILPNDSDKVAEYLIAPRDESLPPFTTKSDRQFCILVFERLLRKLVDLGAITTDQLVLDCIRVFETFSWNVRRETDGYDFILIDELQLFDSQERLAISLLSRSRPGMLFLSVEDPSQGMFSALNERGSALRPEDKVYLEETHRFRAGLFEFISFLYAKFPLNAAPIRVSLSEHKIRKPRLVQATSADEVVALCVDRAREVSQSKEKGRRLCVICVGPIEQNIFDAICRAEVSACVLLRSFDDVELLSYQRKASVVSSWQFVGGAQFSDVVLVTAGVPRPTTAHAKLRELTAIYLGSSRASSALEIICDSRVPDVLQSAIKERLLTKATARPIQGA